MAENIGNQDRQRASDDEIEAANDGHQERRVDVDSKNQVITKPHHLPRAQSEDVTGDALTNDARMDGTSVEMSGTKADRSHDDLGTPVDAPAPAEKH